MRNAIKYNLEAITKRNHKPETYSIRINWFKESDIRIVFSKNYEDCYNDYLEISKSYRKPKALAAISKLKTMFLENKYIGKFIFTQVYIPALRSLSIIEKNLKLATVKIEIGDIFLAHFGNYYGWIKELPFHQGANRQDIKKLVNELLKGEMQISSGKVRIRHDDGRLVDLLHSSSGQQHLVPLILILIQSGHVSAPWNNGNTYIIEEPEAHIFPDAQKKVVELISTVFNGAPGRMQFFITTHSPYILTAFNNLMEAGVVRNMAEDKGDKEALMKLHKIIPKERVLDPNMVRAYALENGGCSLFRSGKIQRCTISPITLRW